MYKSGKGERLLVTGITGFAASWIAYKAIEKGYKVRGTMRDPDNEEKKKILTEGFGEENMKKLELFKADLNDEKSLNEAVKDCHYVLHVASPLPRESPKDPDELIKPAVNSIKAIIKACDEHDVKTLILTSTTGTLEDFSIGDIEVNEEFWTEERDYLLPYQLSKIRAEKAAWEEIEKVNKSREESKKQKINFSTVHPSFIIGPPLIKGEGVSITFFRDCLAGTLPGLPPYYTRAIDVRDLAEAHLRALNATPFKRYVMIERHISFPEIGQLIHDEFSKEGFNPTTNEVGTFMLWVGSWFNKEANYFYNAANVKLYINTEATKEELGFEYTETPKSIKEMCDRLIELGIVEKPTK